MPRSIVFDTSPLRHFALEGWLGVLKYLTRDREVVIPESVEVELMAQRGTEPSLEAVLGADWIRVDRSQDIEFLRAFAHYEQLIASGEHNRGECGVLALGRARGFELIIDDRVPRKHAARDGLDCRGTLALLCEAIREGKLAVDMVEHLADDLLAGQYRLPFEPGEFRVWAGEQGLI